MADGRRTLPDPGPWGVRTLAHLLWGVRKQSPSPCLARIHRLILIDCLRTDIPPPVSPTAFYWPRIQMLCDRRDSVLDQSA
jgi:hypothetical protein